VLGALHRLDTRLVRLLGGERHLQEHHDLVLSRHRHVHADDVQEDARLGELREQRRRSQHALAG